MREEKQMDNSLSWSQRLWLRVFSHVSVGYRTKQSWRAPIEHFAFRCPEHGIVMDYPHGFREELRCPKCLEERKRETE